jgi:hypothetical protein
MTDRFGAEEEMPGGQKSEVNERYGDFSPTIDLDYNYVRRQGLILLL